MNEKGKNMIKFVSKVALITLLTVFVIRCFLFESYTISTSQMESALIPGDEVLVSKLSYGPRMPITPLSIPFTFNRFYSNIIQFPYIRLYSSDLHRNDIVLFNSSLETDKPLDKQSLLISRCVAVPGDTILISDGVYYINGEQYVHSPTIIDEYVVLDDDFKRIKTLSDSLYLDMQSVKQSSDTIYFTLNRYDAFVLNRNTSRDLFYRKNYVIPQTLIFIAPSVGRKAALSENNVKLYRQIIEYEQGDKVRFKDNQVYLNDKKVDVYTFKDDYYWMLSDNTVDALDSRILGFIPFRSVVGRASTILYSSGADGLRSDRFFISIR